MISYMISMLMQRLPSVGLLSACGLILLTVLLSGAKAALAYLRCRQSCLRSLGLLLGAWAALLLVRATESQGDWYSYLYMALNFCVYLLFAQGWQPQPWRAAVCRVMCFYLSLDCIDTLLRFSGMRLLGIDYLRDGPWYAQCAAALILFCVVLPAMLWLRRALPARAVVDGQVLWFALLAAVPYLFVCQLTLWLPLQNEQLTAAVPLLLAASCVLALASITTFVGRLNAEVEKRQALQRQHEMEKSQQQYLLQKSSADAVRRNYHDLKNILYYLEESTDTEALRGYVKKVMGEIRPYETLADTGLEAIDILLSEKLAICQAEQIACTVDVEGKLFAFVSPLDMCVILGNAMDNAIEACLKLSEPTARRILVKSARRGGFALLSIRNTCLPQSIPENTPLPTTKPDRENHGYGLSNLRRAVASYGGEVACRCQNGEFVLTLLLPQPTEAANDKGDTAFV